MKKNREKQLSKKPAADKEMLKLERKKRVSWILYFCFASIWIFLLGVLVGRGTAPVEFDIDALQKELSNYRLTRMESEGNKSRNFDDLLKVKPSFEFHETLKKTRPDLKPDLNIKPVNKAVNPDKVAAKPVPGHKTRKKLKLKSRGRIKNSYVKKNPVTKKRTPIEEGGRLTIQVASLRDVKVADKLVKNLLKKGYPAYKTVGVISADNVWYRVRAGNFKSREDSLKMLAQIKKHHKNAVIMKR